MYYCIKNIYSEFYLVWGQHFVVVNILSWSTCNQQLATAWILLLLIQQYLSLTWPSTTIYQVSFLIWCIFNPRTWGHPTFVLTCHSKWLNDFYLILKEIQLIFWQRAPISTRKTIKNSKIQKGMTIQVCTVPNIFYKNSYNRATFKTTSLV